ncbi:hypothetical protein D3C72_1970440 [compost metagenome]
MVTTLFDSIQVFVKYNLDNNLRSEFHLLSLESYQNDTFTFALTSVLKNKARSEYGKCNYFINSIDNSILIIDDKLNYLYTPLNNSMVSELLGNSINDSEHMSTFNPLIWKVYVTKGKVIMDKLYGQPSESQILTPKKKFALPGR